MSVNGRKATQEEVFARVRAEVSRNPDRWVVIDCGALFAEMGAAGTSVAGIASSPTPRAFSTRISGA